MEYEEFIRKVGTKIKEIRVSKGITQEAMDEGEYAISYRTVQDIENGQSHPSVRSIFKISKRLKVRPKDLLDVQ
ncbi:helix-turn-helix domain-containing protein [Leptospira interrogans]|nr:helix-turn-helix transcriptional regulator [Leptospira interrogans]MBM2888890.1 helix-turn-helix transcriptional regulator [Leptospira interrogans]